jgi:hypothetical protein
MEQPSLAMPGSVSWRPCGGSPWGRGSDMKPQATPPSTQEVLAGLVERVTYHHAENGFCVLRAKARGLFRSHARVSWAW